MSEIYLSIHTPLKRQYVLDFRYFGFFRNQTASKQNDKRL